MFMFWSKRTVLTRRLLKAKVRGEHETECEAQEDSSRIHRTIDTTGAGNDTSGNVTTTVPAGQTSTTTTRGASSSSSSSSSFGGKGQRGGGGGGGGSGSGAVRTSSSSSTSSRLHQGCCGGDQSYDDDEYPSRLLRCKELLKTLKENQLEMLLTAVESCGADLGSCILVPRQQRPFRNSSDSDSEIDDQQQQRLLENTSMDPLVLCCQIWRWPDLMPSEELKRLPICHSAKDPVYVCCNPYHWSRLCKPAPPALLALALALASPPPPLTLPLPLPLPLPSPSPT
ncbi:hypothetical protein M0804_008549 [Polistes exclamans]|nr:hypothetical protein M0804_008549 [Polistes exclamans]